MEGWLTLCFIALATLLALWFSGGRSEPKKHLPPGPWTLPIIGSLHHVLSTLPHRTITDLCRRHGPLMLLKLGEVPTVVVSSAEAVAQVMKTNDVAFSNRQTTELQEIIGFGGKGIIFAPYGDHWRQMRKVCIVELLSSKQVKRMECIRAEEVGSLLRSINTATAAGAAANLSEMFAALGNNVVARAAFGGKFARQEEFLHAMDQIMDLLGGFCLVDLFPSSRLVRGLSNGERRIKRIRDLIEHIITEILDERKVARAAGHGACSTDDEDLLDVLLRLQEDSAYPLTM